MKCVAYDYEFENDLVTRWQELDHSTPGTKSKSRWGRNIPASDSDNQGEDEEEYEECKEEEEGLTSRSRDHLSRRAKCRNPSTRLPRGDTVSASSSHMELSDCEKLGTVCEEDLWYMEQSCLEVVVRYL